MGNGVIANADGATRNQLRKKHLMIVLPGEHVSRAVITKDSLLYVAYSLNKMYVHLHGFYEGAVDIRSLPQDLLKAKVICYKEDTYMTFSAVIAGSGYVVWGTDNNKKGKRK